jgi:hypothetical protein
MKTLIDAGADINAMEQKGNDALYHAICSSNIEAVRLLLTSGNPYHTFLLAAEEVQLNNHHFKRPRPEDLQPPAAIAPVAEAAAPAAEEEEDESEGDSEDEEEEEDD